MSTVVSNGNRRNMQRTGLPPALNPESPALVQPFKEFVSNGWITTLQVVFTPMGTTMECVLADFLLKEEDKQNESNGKKFLPIGVARKRIEEAGLSTSRGRTKTKSPNSQAQPRPQRSLIVEDFLGSDAQLYERAKGVAEKLTSKAASGRIGSLDLMIEGCNTFQEWWDNAPPAHKLRLFMDEKHIKLVDKSHVAKFIGVMKNCPFRDSVPTPKKDEGTEQTAKPKPQETSPKRAEKKQSPNGKASK